MKPLTTITDPRLVKALAHPMRLQILSVLEQRTASPKQIADEIDQPLTHVSYHVRQLAELGVITLVSTRQRRGAIEHLYRMDARPSISDEAWRQAPEIAKQALIGTVLGQVSTQVNAGAAQAGFSRDGARLSRLPLELDERGWREASKAFEGLAAKLERIQEEANARARRPRRSHGRDGRPHAVRGGRGARQEKKQTVGAYPPASQALAVGLARRNATRPAGQARPRALALRTPQARSAGRGRAPYQARRVRSSPPRRGRSSPLARAATPLPRPPAAPPRSDPRRSGPGR